MKTMLRKHAARFGNQWDRYLSGVVWAYRNVPHESTGEKPSFLMFGMDLRTPTEAALLPPAPVEPGDVDNYREEVILSLSSARKLAEESIQRAQQKYKSAYDLKAMERDYRIGDWVLVRFPQEETGKLRKLSRPWHGPYRIVSRSDRDVTVSKVYHPQEGSIQVHQSRVSPCPPHFPAGYFWYGMVTSGMVHDATALGDLLSGFRTSYKVRTSQNLVRSPVLRNLIVERETTMFYQMIQFL